MRHFVVTMFVQPKFRAEKPPQLAWRDRARVGMSSYGGIMDEGPSVNSNDREERIHARSVRIQARIDAMNNDAEDPKVVERKRKERERREFVKGKGQIMESNHRLDRIKTAGIEHVTSVRVNSDDRENRRRIAEEELRQERRHKLLTEAENSAKRNAAIAMKWNAVIAKEIPQDLLAEMNLQKEACERVIAAKDRLRAEFQNELKAKDEEYVKALKRQADDIDQLLKRMSIQFIELRRNYEDELEEIETTFSHERDELLSGNKNEMDKLNDKRREMEQRYMEKRQERAEVGLPHPPPGGRCICLRRFFGGQSRGSPGACRSYREWIKT